MNATEIHGILTEQFGAEAITGLNTESKDPWIEVAADRIADVAAFLKSDSRLRFDSLNDLTAVDYLEPDEKLAKKFPYEEGLAVVYHLYSFDVKHRIVIKVRVPRWKDAASKTLPEVPSVSSVWGIADWHEREAYDLVGVNFTGHPNLLRILCPDDWEGHALRKDYEFPEEYHGVRNL
ncbi:MAG: NADH-quinone oxidoreductase subunit C [Planctomycetaceae bacterium]